MPKVLFLCTGNSCRSQMGEGFLREMGGGRFEVHSAGTEVADEIHPLAVRAMAEVGIDISDQFPKSLDRYDDDHFDLLITVCDQARQACPMFLGADQQVHWSLQDPAEATGTEKEWMAVFREVRDQIRGRVEHLIETGEALNDEGEPARL
ncbi:MAG: arsenate reductase ArsC [Armatimonadota bacterium]